MRFNRSKELGSTAHDMVYLLNASLQLPEMHGNELSEGKRHNPLKKLNTEVQWLFSFKHVRIKTLPKIDNDWQVCRRWERLKNNMMQYVLHIHRSGSSLSANNWLAIIASLFSVKVPGFWVCDDGVGCIFASLLKPSRLPLIASKASSRLFSPVWAQHRRISRVQRVRKTSSGRGRQQQKKKQRGEQDVERHSPWVWHCWAASASVSAPQIVFFSSLPPAFSAAALDVF